MIYLARMSDKTSVASYTGSGVTAALGALSLQEWVAIGGFALAILTFLINWHYQKKRSAAQVEADKEKARYYEQQRSPRRSP